MLQWPLKMVWQQKSRLVHMCQGSHNEDHDKSVENIKIGDTYVYIMVQLYGIFLVTSQRRDVTLELCFGLALHLPPSLMVVWV